MIQLSWHSVPSTSFDYLQFKCHNIHVIIDNEDDGCDTLSGITGMASQGLGLGALQSNILSSCVLMLICKISVPVPQSQKDWSVPS